MDLQEMIEIQKDNGTTLDEMRAAVEKAYAVRSVNGFEVEAGWTMPEPPVPGLVAWVEGDGCDGIHLYWALPEPDGLWGDAATREDRAAFKKAKKASYDLSHDTDALCALVGTDGYKECVAAFVELGFTEGW